MKEKNKKLIIITGILLFGSLAFGHFTYKDILKENNKEEVVSENKSIAAFIKQDDGTYKETEVIPTDGYILNEKKSTCSNGAKVRWKNNELITSNLTKNGTKCYLYFDKIQYTCKGAACDAIMANMNAFKTRDDFSTTLADTTTGVIYKSLDANQYDDNGEVYYFAGNPTDNWIKFAGYYWRIIRINGDGTIRMIYNGPTTDQTGTGTQTTTSAFNSSYKNNMYVGYQYTSGSVHGNGTNSTIKGVLDNWYSSNLGGYASKIATGGGASFCNDRTPHSGPGTGSTYTEYAAYNRLYTNKIPTFKCANTSDRFATSIGLITADEVAYAGGVFNTNNSGYYLYTNQYYWTMSPSNLSSSIASVFYVYSYGYLNYSGAGWTASGVRPVINLKADTTFADGGTGTADNPYVVS